MRFPPSGLCQDPLRVSSRNLVCSAVDSQGGGRLPAPLGMDLQEGGCGRQGDRYYGSDDGCQRCHMHYFVHYHFTLSWARAAMLWPA